MESSLRLSYRIFSVAFVNLSQKRTARDEIIEKIIITIIILILCDQLLYFILEDNSIISKIMIILQNPLIHLGLPKIISFIVWEKQWLEIFKFVEETEHGQKNDKEICYIVNQYSKHGRIVVLFTWIFLGLSFCCIYGKAWYIFMCGMEVSEYHLYWPKNNDGKYLRYLNMLSQHIYAQVSCVYVISWNTTAMLLMTFFAGQLKIVRNRLRHALDCEDETLQRQNLINILNHYNNLKRYSKLCNSLTSSLLFIEMLLVCGNLGVNLREAAIMEKNSSEVLARSSYIAAIITDLALIYWHGNEVTHLSNMVSYGVYESNWTGKSKTICKLIQPVIMATSVPFEFTAGPYNLVSLATMISILRISYSFYTLIAQTT